MEWAARPGLTGVSPVTETLRGQAQLAQGRLDHSAHGGHPAGRCGGGCLRSPWHDHRSRNGTMPGVWAMQDQNLDGVIAGLEAAWAFFGGMSQCLVTGNFPATVCGSVLASGAHLGLSGVRPAPGIHRRPGADRPPTGQAQGGKGRTSTPGSVSSGPRLQRSGPHEGRGPAVVPAVGLNMGLRHHPQEAAGGLPG